MNLRKNIMDLSKKDAKDLRNILSDPKVKDALSVIGILPNILELHAPSPKSRNHKGVGRTLCGINGTRHELVTCKRCLKSLQ